MLSAPFDAYPCSRPEVETFLDASLTDADFVRVDVSASKCYNDIV
jgi:hypothetical protein